MLVVWGQLFFYWFQSQNLLGDEQNFKKGVVKKESIKFKGYLRYKVYLP